MEQRSATFITQPHSCEQTCKPAALYLSGQHEVPLHRGRGGVHEVCHHLREEAQQPNQVASPAAAATTDLVQHVSAACSGRFELVESKEGTAATRSTRGAGACNLDGVCATHIISSPVPPHPSSSGQASGMRAASNCSQCCSGQHTLWGAGQLSTCFLGPWHQMPLAQDQHQLAGHSKVPTHLEGVALVDEKLLPLGAVEHLLCVCADLRGVRVCACWVWYAHP